MRKSMWLRSRLNKFVVWVSQGSSSQRASNCTEAERVHIKRQNKLASEARDKALGNLVDAALARLEMLGDWAHVEGRIKLISTWLEDTIALIATTFTVKKLTGLVSLRGNWATVRVISCWPFEKL